MKKLLAFIFFVCCVGLGLYLGIWVLFISPILVAARNYDAGTLTGAMIVWTVIKCLFSSAIASTLIWVGALPMYLVE